MNEVLFLLGTYITICTWVMGIWVIMGTSTLDWDEAIWWPIIIVKIMILSLFKVLFTGWKL